MCPCLQVRLLSHGLSLTSGHQAVPKAHTALACAPAWAHCSCQSSACICNHGSSRFYDGSCNAIRAHMLVAPPPRCTAAQRSPLHECACGIQQTVCISKDAVKPCKRACNMLHVGRLRSGAAAEQDCQCAQQQLTMPTRDAQAAASVPVQAACTQAHKLSVTRFCGLNADALLG